MNVRYLILGLIMFHFSITTTISQVDSIPVRGFCIGAPSAEDVDQFVEFIEEVLVPANINTLIVRINYNYQFKSHPEMVGEGALSERQVKQIVQACRAENIQLIPLINLLGHQSWASNLGKLLEIYPEFDETPDIELPEEYKWPNEDGLYCKSYCPLHPEVHDVVFDLVDELLEVFEADAVHAGMDEVFYIGYDNCPRCAGRDKARLFAGEVMKIRNHLAQNGKSLWIWGDRLLDGSSTGLGMWEASMNNTHQAIDMIPTDVVICDWHYERAEPTAPYFALKGFDVVTCPWNRPEVATRQLQDLIAFREHANPKLRQRYQGMMQTVWSSFGPFYQAFQQEPSDKDNLHKSVLCFKTWIAAMRELD